MPTRLSLRAFAAAGAIFWGLAVFLSALLYSGSTYGGAWIDLLESIYPGFDITGGPILWNALIGGLYGAADGAVCALLFGWLYNYLLRKFHPWTP